jgi:hypothetical protein
MACTHASSDIYSYLSFKCLHVYAFHVCAECVTFIKISVSCPGRDFNQAPFRYKSEGLPDVLIVTEHAWQKHKHAKSLGRCEVPETVVE